MIASKPTLSLPGAAVEILRLRDVIRHELTVARRDHRLSQEALQRDRTFVNRAIEEGDRLRVERLAKALDPEAVPAAANQDGLVRQVAYPPAMIHQVVGAPIEGLSHAHWQEPAHPVTLTMRTRTIRAQDAVMPRRPYWGVIGTGQTVHPGAFILQLFTMPLTEPPFSIITGNTLEGVRDHLPPRLRGFSYGRPESSADIIEIWVP